MKILKRCEGMLSLEACIVMPAFIILMLMVDGLIIMFMGQHIISHAMIQSAKSLALDPYMVQRTTADDEGKLAILFEDLFSIGGGDHISTEAWYDSTDKDKLEEVVKERFLTYIRPSDDSVNKIMDVIGVENGIDGLDFSESSVDEGVLTLKVRYKQRFLFNAGGLASFLRTVQVKVKLFQYKK